MSKNNDQLAILQLDRAWDKLPTWGAKFKEAPTLGGHVNEWPMSECLLKFYTLVPHLLHSSPGPVLEETYIKEGQ